LTLPNFWKKTISILIIFKLVVVGLFGYGTVINESQADSESFIHDAGNLTFSVDSHGTFPFCMKYNDVQQSDSMGGWLDETYFFFDQSQYVHSGPGDIATGRQMQPGGDPAEFASTGQDKPFSMVKDGIVDESHGSYTKVKDINGQVNDIRVDQRAWSMYNESWGITQWTVTNLLDTTLTEVRLGLRFYSAVGGDNTDDKVYWDADKKFYYIKDSGTMTYFGFASADSGTPLNLYWDGSINDLTVDGDLYNAIKASPHVSGFHQDLGCVLGWTDDEIQNNGMTISAKDRITRVLVFAAETSLSDLYDSIERARQFYLPRSLVINEIADEGTQQVEIYNLASTAVDLGDFRFSANGGVTFWDDGKWDNDPIPANGYSVWTLEGNDKFYGPEGTKLRLYNTTNYEKLDEVSLGQFGIVPDPIDDATISSVSKVHGNRWVHSLSGATFGGPNPEDMSIGTIRDIVLNEVMFNPESPEFGFIELMYIGGTELDIQGYSIITDSRFEITESQILHPDDPYFVIFRDDAPWLFDGGMMSKSGDNIYLYDSEGDLLDMVGWNSEHEINRTVKRVIEGEGSHFAFNDLTSMNSGWVFDSKPTIPMVVIGPKKQFVYTEDNDDVWFDLSVKNKMIARDLFDISYIIPLDWTASIYKDDRKTEITDSDGDDIPDIYIDEQSEIKISISITIPKNGISGDHRNISVTTTANLDLAVEDTALLQTRFYPYLLAKKSVDPSKINILGTGYEENATITLTVEGNGFGVPSYKPQDVVFVVDRSDSMNNDEIDLAKQAVTEFVENMSSPDRGCVVHFDSNVVLMSPLTGSYAKLKNDVNNIPGPGDLTYMGEALLEALKELVKNGDEDQIHVIILYTDGGWNGELDPITVANWARENNTLIFTIGLGNGAYNILLKEIAEITGAENFTAETIDEFRKTYQQIANFLDKTAGRDPDTGDSNPMIRDVLPPWIEYIPGSFSIPPDVIYENGTGYTFLEWNVDVIFINEVWSVTFNITSSKAGYLEANNYTHSRISYMDWAESHLEKLFPRTMIYVINAKPKPPELFIEIIDQYGYPKGTGDLVRLFWTPPTHPGIDHYLIYRSEDQRTFDFQSPWIRTDMDNDNGVLPLRTTWNDTEAADSENTNYKKQMYYTIRAVNSEGEASSTSRTVGKITYLFPRGITPFSLPFQPFKINDAGWYVTDMGANYLNWMNQDHEWQMYEPSENESVKPDILLGNGYEIRFNRPTQYTFFGLPAAGIRYEETAFGFDYDPISGEASSLSASVDDQGTVHLSWEQPENLGPDYEYYVLRSSKRDGFWGIINEDYIILAQLPFDTTSIEDIGVAMEDTEYYYMIIPVDKTTWEWGTSCYSIGVVTEGFELGYDTLGLPLEPADDLSVSWFCQDNPDLLGMNFYLPKEYRWVWHKRNMPQKVYDSKIKIMLGYQVSTVDTFKYSFVGF
jgi:hypothetical protein